MLRLFSPNLSVFDHHRLGALRSSAEWLTARLVVAGSFSAQHWVSALLMSALKLALVQKFVEEGSAATMPGAKLAADYSARLVSQLQRCARV